MCFSSSLPGAPSQRSLSRLAGGLVQKGSGLLYGKDGDPFDVAFEKALGIPVSWFLDNFYLLMEDYLQKTEFIE